MANNEIEAVTSNEALNKKELGELEKLEKKYRKGAESFLLMGEALAEISNKKLYRSYGTFEKYCEKKLDLHRQTGYKLINAWETYLGLQAVGYKKQYPSTESQYRELSIVKDVSDQVKVLDQLYDSHPNDSITAKKIKEVVLAYYPPESDDKGKKNTSKTSKPRSKFNISLPIDNVKIHKNSIVFTNSTDPKVEDFLTDLKQKLKESGKIEIFYTPTEKKQKPKTKGTKQKSKTTASKRNSKTVESEERKLRREAQYQRVREKFKEQENQ
jgi:hypothetical protein